MNEVIDASAAPSPAPEIIETTPAPVKEATVYDTDPLSREERSARFAKGDFPKRIDKPAPAASQPATPAGREPGTEAASEPADPEEKPNETPEERKRRHRGLREELGRSNAELGKSKDHIKALEAQIAESRKPAPAAAKAEPAKEAELPDLDDYLAQGKNVKQWQADYGKAVLDRAAKITESAIESRFAKEQTTAQTAEKSKVFTASMTAGKAKYKDFEAVADRAPINAVMAESLRGNPQVGEIIYFLGNPANAEEAKRILAETDIDGLSYEALKTAQSNPAISARTNTALGIAREALNAIARNLGKSQPAQITEKTITSTPPAPRAVGGSGNAGDPIAAAWKRGDRDTALKLMHERDLAKLKGK